MKTPRIVNAMQYIDEDLITDAINYVPKKKKSLIRTKWAVMAACLSIVLIAVTVLKNFMPQELRTADHLLIIEAEVEGQEPDGFKATITKTNKSDLFPVNTEIFVVFDKNTGLILADDNQYIYDMDIQDINFKIGSKVEIGFFKYLPSQNNRSVTYIYAYYVKSGTVNEDSTLSE